MERQNVCGSVDQSTIRKGYRNGNPPDIVVGDSYGWLGKEIQEGN